MGKNVGNIFSVYAPQVGRPDYAATLRDIHCGCLYNRGILSTKIRFEAGSNVHKLNLKLMVTVKERLLKD